MELLTKPLEKPNRSLSTPRPTDSTRLEKAAGLLRDTALPGRAAHRSRAEIAPAAARTRSLSVSCPSRR